MAPDYKTNDPRGWCGDPARGAALGRVTLRGKEGRRNSKGEVVGGFRGTLTVRQILLDSGGYDCNGTYFGTGDPLFWVASEDGEIDRMLRAKNREAANRQILEIYPRAKFKVFVDLDTFFQSFLEAALWSTHDDREDVDGEEPHGEFLDAEFGPDDFSAGTLEEFRHECDEFANQNADAIRGREAEAGQDFWLTRNGHGAGFWDGDWPKEVGKALTERSKAYGSIDLYVGDDGKIYT
jgi:hypothetical protein